MRFRFKAFAVHLSSSATVLALILGGLYLGWYDWPGWWLVKALPVALIAVLVDVVLGPTLTLIIANPAKPRRELTRDIAIIVAVQICALSYGAFTLWQGRPLYYTFSESRLEVVQASEIKPDEAAQGRRVNPSLAPHWYSRPRWIYAPLPDDPETAKKIMTSATFGTGEDVVDMPGYFKPWEQGIPELRKHLKAVKDMTELSATEKRRAEKLMSARGLGFNEPNAMVMYGTARHLIAIFDVQTVRLRTYLNLE
jgi:hypothetical protein